MDGCWRPSVFRLHWRGVFSDMVHITMPQIGKGVLHQDIAYSGLWRVLLISNLITERRAMHPAVQRSSIDIPSVELHNTGLMMRHSRYAYNYKNWAIFVRQRYWLISTDIRVTQMTAVYRPRSMSRRKSVSNGYASLIDSDIILRVVESSASHRDAIVCLCLKRASILTSIYATWTDSFC